MYNCDSVCIGAAIFLFLTVGFAQSLSPIKGQRKHWKPDIALAIICMMTVIKLSTAIAGLTVTCSPAWSLSNWPCMQMPPLFCCCQTQDRTSQSRAHTCGQGTIIQRLTMNSHSDCAEGQIYVTDRQGRDAWWGRTEEELPVWQ